MIKKLFIPAKLSNELLLLGFDKSECIAGDTFGKTRFKLTHTNDGDVIQWDKEDHSEPLILKQQAFDFFSTKGLIVTPCSMIIGDKALFFAMPHGDAEEYYSWEAFYHTIIVDIPKDHKEPWEYVHDKAIIENRFVLEYSDSEIQCIEILISIYKGLKNE